MTSAVEDEAEKELLWPDKVVIGFLAITMVLYWATTATVESMGSDTSTYFGLAQSLLHGHGYRFNFEPHTVYPPGYPLILAGMMALVGESFGMLVKLSVLVYFIGLGGLYYFLRLQRDARTALAVVLLTGTSYVAYFWTTVGLHSETPYFVVSVGALLSVSLAQRAASRRGRLLAITSAALCGAYLPLVRTIGVTFLLGLSLWVAWPTLAFWRPGGESSRARAKRWAPAVLLGVTVLAAWMTWAGRSGPRFEGEAYMGSYVQQLMKSDPHQIDSPELTWKQVPARVVQMAAVQTQRGTAMMLNLPNRSFSWGNPLALLVLLGALVLVGTGFLESLLGDATLVDCYVLAYGAVLLVWPFDEGWRFLFPIQPFLLLYAIGGLNTVCERLGRVSRGRFPSTDRMFAVGKAGLFLGIVATGTYYSALLAPLNLAAEPTVASHEGNASVVRWIRQCTAEDAVIMDDHPAVLHRLTGRRTYRFPLFTDPGRIEELIAESGADVVIVMDEEPDEYFNPSTMRRFAAVRARAPELFEQVYAFDQGRVFRVRRDAAPLPVGSSTCETTPLP